ncbi:MAG: HAD-IA family hydrolase [Candidatus Omnitrophota bacterium]
MSATKGLANNIKLVIFDLDGTLVDAYDAISRSFNYTLKKLGLKTEDDLTIRRAVGWGDKQLLSPFVKEKDRAKALLLYRSHHKAALLKYSHLFPQVKYVLRHLKDKGYKLAVASNRPTKFSLILIRHLGIKKYFDYWLCADKIKYGKPNPEILRRVIRKFSLNPQQALYVGDMAIDAQTGRRAGINTIIVTTGSSSPAEIKREKPALVIRDISELLKTLQRYPKSKVYYIPVKNSDDINSISRKLKALLKKSGILDFTHRGYKTAVKMHFGEEGNTGFVRPEYVRIICDELKRKGAAAFLSDTNALYHGRRTNSKDHLALAAEHGFTQESIGTKIIIPDDKKKANTVDVKIGQKFIGAAKIARIFIESDTLIAISHFKGHIMTGFGGSLKNVGMGCAARAGKLMQHSDVSPVVYEAKCTGCAACFKVCPAGAIQIKNNKSVINGLKCIGCASCIAVCPQGAIDVNWESGGRNLAQKMVEYAFAVLKNKKKMAFFNFAVKITKECDCLAKDDPRIAPDVGIFASTDPVSVDKASLDLVNKACGRDIFQELHPNRDGTIQLKYAHSLGLGNLDYELIEL